MNPYDLTLAQRVALQKEARKANDKWLREQKTAR